VSRSRSTCVRSDGWRQI